LAFFFGFSYEVRLYKHRSGREREEAMEAAGALIDEGEVRSQWFE
jgi:hypothetical protein